MVDKAQAEEAWSFFRRQNLYKLSKLREISSLAYSDRADTPEKIYMAADLAIRDSVDRDVLAVVEAAREVEKGYHNASFLKDELQELFKALQALDAKEATGGSD